MNTINRNYMTKTFGSVGKNRSQKASQKNMAGITAEMLSENEKTGNTTQTSAAKATSPKDMGMEEYKEYIHNKISEIPMHPSRMQENISINISDAGFEAMKNDPEYEAWVLNDLRVGWAQPDRCSGALGGAYSTIYYGATKEECHAEMWSAGYQGGSGKSLFENNSKDSYWVRRAEKHREYMELQAEQMRNRLHMEHNNNGNYQNNIIKKAVSAYTQYIG